MNETLLGLLGIIVTGVGAGFKVLWSRVAKEMDECKEDRKLLNARVDVLDQKLAACPAPNCPNHPAWSHGQNTARQHPTT